MVVAIIKKIPKVVKKVSKKKKKVEAPLEVKKGPRADKKDMYGNPLAEKGSPYETVDQFGETTQASGLIAIPDNNMASFVLVLIFERYAVNRVITKNGAIYALENTARM